MHICICMLSATYFVLQADKHILCLNTDSYFNLLKMFQHIKSLLICSATMYINRSIHVCRDRFQVRSATIAPCRMAEIRSCLMAQPREYVQRRTSCPDYKHFSDASPKHTSRISLILPMWLYLYRNRIFYEASAKCTTTRTSTASLQHPCHSASGLPSQATALQRLEQFEQSLRSFLTCII